MWDGFDWKRYLHSFFWEHARLPIEIRRRHVWNTVRAHNHAIFQNTEDITLAVSRSETGLSRQSFSRGSNDAQIVVPGY